MIEEWLEQEDAMRSEKQCRQSNGPKQLLSEGLVAQEDGRPQL